MSEHDKELTDIVDAMGRIVGKHADTLTASDLLAATVTAMFGYFDTREVEAALALAGIEQGNACVDLSAAALERAFARARAEIGGSA